ncbi:MAG: M1 family metallopeptidase [Myxococcota bacterium]|nr:M1 family metallopeptidase [Myxococcota bacterium]
MARPDPHSYYDDTQPRVRELEWKARVDFTTHRLDAQATLILDPKGEGPIDLDGRDLELREVRAESGEQLQFTVEPPDKVLGNRIRIQLPAGTRRFTVHYRTGASASALQWLTPAQTAGGKHPFLFSQCQAIHARSLVPLQDTPAVRITFRAELTVPKALKAVFAAAFLSRTEQGPEAVEQFAMNQPIPPYLLAFAVGDLVSRDLGPRSRVWAEPSVVDKAAHEFAGVEDFITAAEKLFGPYDWDRFDVLTMPPSFPYGGMENPRLTFITPTLLAGDRSLVNVLAHELAHSWTGNLVTNTSAEHFWLNEGFTVFAERRILEALAGEETASLHAALGRRSLDEALSQLAGTPEFTRLRTHLDGVDPDEVFSQVPYEKGYLFLRTLEEQVGREAFSGFLQKYLRRYRFQSLTTEEFLEFAGRELPPGTLEAVNAEAWVNGAGVPDNAPRPRSARLEQIEKLAGGDPGAAAARFGPTEWQLFLESVPRPASAAFLEKLDAEHHLTSSTNYEVLVAWLVLATRSGYAPALERVGQVLRGVGRMKYLKPLYQALASRAETRELARSTFEAAFDTYHPIAKQVVESLLRGHGA